jgi:hypothetical protein
LVKYKRRPQISSTTFFRIIYAFVALPAPASPARAGSKPDAYATRSDTNSDAGAIIVIAPIVISAAFDVTLTGCIVITVTVSLLNDDATAATSAVATAIFIADQPNIFNTVVRQ